jgi:hypothetical protein
MPLASTVIRMVASAALVQAFMTVLPVPVDVPVEVVALPPVPVEVLVLVELVVSLPPAPVEVPVVPVLDVESEELQAKRATAEAAAKRRWSEERDMSDPFP